MLKIIVATLIAILITSVAAAAPVPVPNISIGIGEGNNPEAVSAGVKILILLTILSLAPAILIMLTGFTRIIIVFHFLRQALGTQQMPPNQVIIGLALFLTFFIMSPYFIQINDEAIQPYLKKSITQEETIQRAAEPLKKFMFKQTREKDLALFVELSGKKNLKSKQETPFFVLVPAFVISELKTAFQIGFLIYIPFLVIDIVVASVLLSMGMMMLPPVMISLPFKIILFVLVDGWYLIVGSLVKSFY